MGNILKMINRIQSNIKQMQVKLLKPDAKVPTQGSIYSAGWDLYSNESKTITPGGRALIKTDIAIALPHGTYGRVAPRSGLAVKHGIDVLAGVIDNDYRGNVGVVLINFGDENVNILKGVRIAQLIVEEYREEEITVVESLQDTVRGDGGFGSTGN